MPAIQLILPGEQRTTVLPFAETYRITVERLDDGMACTEVEARTTLSMYCIHSLQKQPKKRKAKERPATS